MVNRILKFTWDEWKWLAVMTMLAVVMYWTAIVVEPTMTLTEDTITLIEEAQETQQLIQDNLRIALAQNQLIIDNQNNNTNRLERIITKQGQLSDNQLTLTRGLGNAADTITNQSNLLVLQGQDIKKIVEFFRNNFNETFLTGEDLERASTQDILGNVTQIRNILLLQEIHPNQTFIDTLIQKEMRNWIAELNNNLTQAATTAMR